MKKLNKLIVPFIIFAVILAVYLIYQFYWIGPYRLAGNDGYFYLARAKLMIENCFLAGSSQNYIPFTLWGLLSGDNTIIYVWFISPLTTFSDPISAAKIFSSILVALFGLIIYIFTFRKTNSKLYATIITLGALFLNIAFFLKYTEIRALTIGVVLFFISYYQILIYKKHYWTLAPLAFLYVYFHTSAYLMFLPIVILLCIKRTKETFFELIIPAGYILIGMVIAFLTFPTTNFFQIYSTQVVIPIIYLAAPFTINGGYENKGDWRTPDNLIISNAFNILLLGIALLFFLKNRKHLKLDVHQISAFIIFVLMIILDLVSRRFAEYMAPSAILFAILFYKEIKRTIVWLIDVFKSSRKVKITTVIIILVVSVFAGYKIYGKYFVNDATNTNYKGEVKTDHPETWAVAEYMNKVIPAGSYIFNNAWEDFPSLFYKANSFKYAAGMELGFMYLYDSEMLKFYQDLRDGTDVGNPVPIIKNQFRSSYALIKKGEYEPGLNSIIENDQFTLLYEDDFYYLFSL